MKNNSVGVLFSAKHKIRSNDTEYPFRQDSNFYYMSGFKEDNSSLIFVKRKNETKVILFVAKKDAQQELWNGKRLGEEEAKKRFFVDEVYSSDKFEEILKEHLKLSTALYFDFSLDYSKVKILKRYAKKLSTHKNLALHVEKMRLIKSKAEINLIKRAISITKEAHHHAMSYNKLSKSEYELQAELEYIFKKRGAYSDAYTSIVACGNSANTLHYIENNKSFVNGELVLIDAGCEYNYYASDITRTIAVNAKFSEPQKELYNLVLSVNQKIISMIKPGVYRSKLQRKAIKMLTKGMLKLKILKGRYKKLIKKEAYKKYYPHGIGHWMGLDVHDNAPYKDKKGKEIALAKGMVLTIEPGIYIDENDKDVPKKYRGIGIRIEDNILVTQNSYENLSKEIVKSIEDIERLSIQS
jgi:Xaa-Pro aminopeptidase